MNKTDYSLKELLKTVARSKKYIIRVILAALILSIVISLLLPVYYKAQTTFYAASPDLGLPNQVGTTEKIKSVYGGDFDIDRLLSISESDNLYAYLIQEFNLYEHYDIDTSNVKAPYYVREELKDMFKVLKTKLDAIQLTVEDQDPLFAANMANAARNRISDIAQDLMKKSQKETLLSYQDNIKKQDQAVQSISDSIAHYRNLYNIINTETQGETYSELIATTDAKIEEYKSTRDYYKENGGRRDSIRRYDRLYQTTLMKSKALKAKAETYNSGSGKIKKLVIEYERLINQLAIDRQREALLNATYSNPFTALHVVQEAHPPVIKSRPVRSLVVIASTLLAALLSIGFVLLKEGFKGWNWKEILNG